MNKKIIIYIVIGIVATIIIGLSLYFILKVNSSKSNKNPYTAQSALIIEYMDSETPKTVEISDKKELKELNKICENISLEQDEDSKYLAIRNDIKLDLKNGIIFFIQKDLKEYCYIENTNTGDKYIIRIPEGLLQYIENLLNKSV